MRGKSTVAVWLLGGLVATAFAAGPGYRPDYDYKGRDDAWYGRTKPDPRRDFPANPVELASNGDDFDRNYEPLAARSGAVPPLARTDGPGSPYVFFHSSAPEQGGADCDFNGIPDACDLDCGPPAGACDVPGCGTASDCNADTVPDSCQLSGADCDSNGVPDTCQIAAAAAGCTFPGMLLDNGTTTTDDVFLGPPDDIYFGLGGQIVTYDVGCGFLIDGPGADLTVYEYDAASVEFSSVDVLASYDGVQFFSLKPSETVPINLPGDGAHVNRRFARSYDLAVVGLSAARYVRLDGAGTGASGTSTGFDLDAVGFVNLASDDCDSSGVLDVCEALSDCNANLIPESCEFAAGAIADCDLSGTPDTCDTLGGANDCDGDTVPDSCEADCNANLTPDDCDIATLVSQDCNGNAVPDECDLVATSVVIEPSGTTSATTIVFSEDFETPDTTNFITYNAGESIVTATTTWSVITSGVDLYEAPARPEAAAYDGTQAVDLTGSPGAGVLETSIATTPGQAYELVFHYARNALLGADTGDAEVEVLGGSSLLQATIQHDPALHLFDAYLEFRGAFVADASSTTLRFTSLDAGNTGITLDGISVATVILGGPVLTVGSDFAPTFSAPAPFAAASDVTVTMTALSDLGATNEYIDLEVNAIPLARFFETDGLQCAESTGVSTIPADAFNVAVAGGSATIGLIASGSVNAFECADSYSIASLRYTPVVDCNANGTLDTCDIAAATSTDVNLNGIADECETDCNGNALPDDYDLSQGTSADCNANGVPDECDSASGTSDDCDLNGVPDECEADCNANGVNDVCDIASATSTDCDVNGVPDECDIGTLPDGCVFPRTLSENTTAVADSVYLGAPDGVYRGLGGQIVTYDLDCAAIVDGFGPDFNIYEVGGAEYGSIDVYVSGDGVNFVNINEGLTPRVPIPGDLFSGAPRGFDLAATGLRVARFVRIDGVGTGSDGTGTGFDLDAIGVINGLNNDCDNDGTLDECQTADDCNGNRVPESCEFLNNWVDDCDFSGTPDTCDTLGGIDDCDGDSVPDVCETDCNTNVTPDECEIAAMTAPDCNGNVVPDECDLGISSVSANFDLIPIGGLIPRTWTLLSPPPASTDIALNFFGFGNFAATSEYIDVLLNGVVVGRIFETGAFDCAGSFDSLIVPADTYNLLVAGTDAVWTFEASPQVSATQCSPTSFNVNLFYNAVIDCNTNTTIDSCDIGAMTSFDVNLNGLPDECEADCNSNGTPDDYDIAQGISLDCNANTIPDECDIASLNSDDCDLNGVPDECEADCNSNGVNDVCDIASMTSGDCDLNGIPDECDLVFATTGCSFPGVLLDNGTTDVDATFLGAPDGVYFGLGGQIVTYAFECGFVLDGPGPDFNVYELITGSVEFTLLEDVLVSADGVNFVSVKATEGPVVRIPGDSAHTNDNFARSYEIFATGLKTVRYVRLDGVGTGPSGTGTGFDLDAIGAIHSAGVDCDASGVLDRCETFDDCNVNEFPDSCEIALGVNDDCDANGTADSCDIMGGGQDIDADWILDACEPDCNGNTLPDDYDIAQGTESDCNDNLVPDACDLTAGTSLDCNLDGVPDDCPVCPTVEVTFVMDTSSSMNDEGAALCAELQQVVADLQADLVNVDTELLGILSTGGATFSCLTDTVGNLYGLAVPGSPAPGSEVLGDPCGANLNEDWGPATAIVAGLKPWLPDSVRLIVPISDEGPRCGDPVNDPGDDRDSILNAIGQADANDVIVSPITGTGSSAGVIAMGDLIAGATGGQTFQSTDPQLDLAQAIRDILVDACFDRTDCNANTIPDTCDLDAMTSNDCDMSGRPDECENDCNANGLEDSCDIAAMTSADDNLNAIPDECEGITLTASPTDWTWTGVAGALGYDVLQGDLIGLIGAAGDFATTTDQCLVNDHAAQDWPLGADPGPGQAFWYLVRGVIGSGPLSYDGFGLGLSAGRDAGIGASGNDCP